MILYFAPRPGFNPMSWEKALALYEIRTLIARNRTSLISFAELPNDLAAILTARHLLRRGETFEVWRGSTLVYRIAPPLQPR